jgi:hypothetical protein
MHFSYCSDVIQVMVPWTIYLSSITVPDLVHYRFGLKSDLFFLLSVRKVIFISGQEAL